MTLREGSPPTGSSEPVSDPNPGLVVSGFEAILNAVEGGAANRTSDPAFYEPGGGATAADFQNLVNVVFERTQPGSLERQIAINGLSEVGFFVPTDNLNFWINATPEQVAAESAGLGVAVDRLVSEEQGGTQLPLPEPSPPGTERVGPPEASSVIPEGARLVRITDPAGSDLDELFILIGSAFGVDIAFEIGSRERLDELFGGPDSFDDVTTLTQSAFDNSGAITVGDVDEAIGATGSIQAQMERNLRAAGLENPPQWLAQDQQAMARWMVGVNEGFSAERLWSDISDTDAFKGRFAGLDTIFTQLGTNQFVTAIAEFTNREGAIRSSINQRRGPGADTSIEYVSSLIASGWQPAEIDELLVLERQLRDSPEALDNMNQILAFQELPELTPDDFISFLQDGQRLAVDPAFIPGDLFEGINDALRFQALIEEGLQIDLEFATELGEGTSDEIRSPAQFSERARLAAIEIARNTTEIERETLGISREAIIAAAFGEESPTGESVSEINELLERLGRDRAKRATGLPGAASFVDALGRLRVQGSSNL